MQIAAPGSQLAFAVRWIAGAAIAAAAFVPVSLEAQRGGRGAAPARPPAKPAAPAPAPPPPQITVAGVRVVGLGLGANGSELHAFNDRPGTAIALAIQAPAGSG